MNAGPCGTPCVTEASNGQLGTLHMAGNSGVSTFQVHSVNTFAVMPLIVSARWYTGRGSASTSLTALVSALPPGITCRSSALPESCDVTAYQPCRFAGTVTTNSPLSAASGAARLSVRNVWSTLVSDESRRSMADESPTLPSSVAVFRSASVAIGEALKYTRCFHPVPGGGFQVRNVCPS